MMALSSWQLVAWIRLLDKFKFYIEKLYMKNCITSDTNLRRVSALLGFARQLGSDEALAAVSGAGMTAIAHWVITTSSGGVPSGWLLAGALPVVDPICEKVGLLGRYFLAASRDTKPGTLPTRFGRAMRERGGWRVLCADVLFHDTSYGLIMGVATYSLKPESPLEAGLLSVTCFSIAVVFAAIAQCAAEGVLSRATFVWRKFLQSL